MKLVTYEANEGNRVGALIGESVVDIARAIHILEKGQIPKGELSRGAFEEVTRSVLEAGPAPHDMIAVLERDTVWLTALDEVLHAVAGSHGSQDLPKGLLTALAAARLRAPIARPGKITCVGLNYASHAHEQGKEPPARPVFFLKSSNAICGPGDPIVLPINSTQVDYEAEFAVVIGKGGKQIPEEKVYEHIAGYMILNDVSARDMQASDRQWFRAKSCDTFGPTGPWIVTQDEISEPHNLRISLTLNGQTMQDSNTRDLIFKVPHLVSYLSQSLTWEPGDILATGTPGGVGVLRKPPVFLKPGDTVSVTVERLGTLTNPVAARPQS